MTYYKDITAEYEDIEDRYELMVERIRSITKEEFCKNWRIFTAVR